MRGLGVGLCVLAAAALIGAVLQLRTPRPETLPPAAPKRVAPPGGATAAAPAKATARVSLDIPASYRGQLIRKRVRYFPHKLLALTFDDGPDPAITPLVLKTLKEYNARATFFVLGSCAKTRPKLIRQAADEGHAVESHAYSHPSSTSPSEALSQLQKTATAIEQGTGRKPQLFRPPYGITTGNLTSTAKKQGYGIVLWTISSADSNPITAASIARNVIHTPNPGDIVLMHDGAGHKATAAALPQILKELTAAGFKFVTVNELLQQWALWQAQQVKTTHAAKQSGSGN